MRWLKKFAIQEDPNRPIPKEAYGWRIYTTTACASLAAAMAGYDNAYIGGTIALPSFQRVFGITPETSADLSSNIVSTLVGGCFVGSLFAYAVTEHWGRRMALLASGLFAILGGLLQVVASGQIGLLYAGRGVTGISIGFLAIAVPVYISEVAPPSIRGRLIGIADVCVMVAQVIGYWINYGVKIHMPSTDAQWRIPVAIQLVAPGLLILAMPTMIESPRWLVAKGRNEQARRDLAWIRNLPEDHEYVRWELGEIVADLNETNPASSGGWKAIRTMWKDLNARGMQRRLVLSCLSKVMHSLTGVAALTLYSPLIFKNIGFTNPNDDLLFTGIYGAVKVVATSTFLFLFIDTWGRRKTLLSGSLIIVFSLAYLGAYTQISRSFLQPTPRDAAAYTALLVLYLFTAAFAYSWAVFPPIFAAEIFPTRLRAPAMTLINLVQWTIHFGVAYSIPFMLRSLRFGTFYIFAAATAVSTGVVWFLVPETKGFPLEKMDLIFEGPRWARQARARAEKLLEEELRRERADSVLREKEDEEEEEEERKKQAVVNVVEV